MTSLGFLKYNFNVKLDANKMFSSQISLELICNTKSSLHDSILFCSNLYFQKLIVDMCPFCTNIVADRSTPFLQTDR